MPRPATPKKTRKKAKPPTVAKASAKRPPPNAKPAPEAVSPFHHIQHAKKRAFLAAYSQVGTITHAAKAAGVDRTLHFHWMKTDEQFVEAFAQARESFADELEFEAMRRARHGVQQDVFYQGVKIATKRDYSDALIIFMLKGARPEKYGDIQGGPGGMNINVNIVDAQAVMKRLDAETPQTLQLDTAKGQSGDMMKAIDATVIDAPQPS